MSLGRRFNQTNPFTGDLSQDRTKEDIRELANKLNNIPFLVGKKLTIEFVGGNTMIIPHGLGFKPQGYIVTRMYKDTGSVVGYHPVLLEEPTNSIIKLGLNTSATVDIWIY